MNLCPCGNPTASGPLCFYCECGISEAATREVTAAKRLAVSGDWHCPLTGEVRTVWPQFTLVRTEEGRFLCLPGVWRPAGKGALIAVYARSASGRWIRREVPHAA